MTVSTCLFQSLKRDDSCGLSDSETDANLCVERVRTTRCGLVQECAGKDQAATSKAPRRAFCFQEMNMNMNMILLLMLGVRRVVELTSVYPASFDSTIAATTKTTEVRDIMAERMRCCRSRSGDGQTEC